MTKEENAQMSKLSEKVGMIGQNELNLSHGDVCIGLQYWLNHCVFKDGAAVAVLEVDDMGNNRFKIRVIPAGDL